MFYLVVTLPESSGGVTRSSEVWMRISSVSLWRGYNNFVAIADHAEVKVDVFWFFSGGTICPFVCSTICRLSALVVYENQLFRRYGWVHEPFSAKHPSEA